ncbi:hypothetical protein D3C85_876380 [compost metagenome]
MASRVRLRGLASLSPFCNLSSAAKGLRAATRRAAGRTCRPWGLSTTTSQRSQPSSAGGAASITAEASLAGSMACLGPNAPSASAATSSRPRPAPAATTAARVPSTSGAGQSRTLALSSGGSSSSAVSALSRALPRSISTSTPLPSSASSIALITAMASVPMGCAGSSTPAASSRRAGLPSCAASSCNPAARVALWETTTMPIMLQPRSVTQGGQQQQGRGGPGILMAYAALAKIAGAPLAGLHLYGRLGTGGGGRHRLVQRLVE